MRKIGPLLLLAALSAAIWMYFYVQIKDSAWGTFGLGLVASDVFFGLLFLVAVSMVVWALLSPKERP